MNDKIFKAAFVVFVLSICGFAKAGIVYQHDDGIGETSIASTNTTHSNIWLNAFQAVAGGEIITDISIAFGENGVQGAPNNGDPFTAYIWSDPTNDGNPLDAIVAGTFDGTMQNTHTDTFINFLFNTPITFDIGEWFYVGFQAIGFATSLDTTTSQGQSFLFSDFGSGTINANNLSGAAAGGEMGTLGFPGNTLIRANGISAVPSPSALLIFAFGMLGLAFRRFVK